MAFSNEVLLQAWRRAGGYCEQCSEKVTWALRGSELGGGWEADHHVPVSDGGSDRLDNCRILCTPCHKATPSYGRS